MPNHPGNECGRVEADIDVASPRDTILAADPPAATLQQTPSLVAQPADIHIAMEERIMSDPSSGISQADIETHEFHNRSKSLARENSRSVDEDMTPTPSKPRRTKCFPEPLKRGTTNQRFQKSDKHHMKEEEEAFKRRIKEDTAYIQSRSRVDNQGLTQGEVDEKPWKYIGYRGYTEFIASENDFFMLRRFASVSARIALSLQDQVTVLEDRLNELDWKYSRKNSEDVNNGSFRDDYDERAEVLELLRLKILRYNEFILQQAEIKKHPTASAQDTMSLQIWHWNHQNKAIDKAEHEYLSHTHDLFAVVPKNKTPLRRLLEKSATFRIHWLWKEEKAPVLPLYDKDVVNYISDKKIDTFITVLIIGVGMAMLIAPMWVLDYLDKSAAKLGTITIFVVVFLGMIGYASVATPFEVLAATAA